jgi:hypothetical protein
VRGQADGLVIHAKASGPTINVENILIMKMNCMLFTMVCGCWCSMRAVPSLRPPKSEQFKVANTAGRGS